MEFPEPEDVKIFEGFQDMSEEKLLELYGSLNLAMTFKDFQHIQNYFRNEEKRDPSVTEVRVLDTYWSCLLYTSFLYSGVYIAEQQSNSIWITPDSLSIRRQPYGNLLACLQLPYIFDTLIKR